jgi:hypothetical protein
MQRLMASLAVLLWPYLRYWKTVPDRKPGSSTKHDVYCTFSTLAVHAYQSHGEKVKEDSKTAWLKALFMLIPNVFIPK